MLIDEKVVGEMGIAKDDSDRTREPPAPRPRRDRRPSGASSAVPPRIGSQPNAIIGGTNKTRPTGPFVRQPTRS